MAKPALARGTRPDRAPTSRRRIETHFREEARSSRSLRALAEQVEDEAGYLRFLAALAADWEEPPPRRRQPASRSAPSPLGWENSSIGGFLDAAATWGETPATACRAIQANAWRRAAQLMLAGKF